MLGGRLRDLLEAGELAVDLRADVLGQLELGERGAQLVDLRLGRVLLAELVLDRLELLAQDPLALALLHLGVDLALDLGADRDDVELAGEDLGQPSQPAGDVDLLQQRLALLGLDPQRAGDQVAERGRVVEVGDRHLQLLGEVRDLLDDVAERLLDVAHQRGQLRAFLDDVGQLGDARREVGLLAASTRRCARAGRPGRGSAATAVGHLEHARDHAGDADVVQLVGPGRLGLGLAAGDHHEHPVADQHVVDELDRALLPDRQRRQRVGVGDRVAQRENGELARQRDVCRGGLAVAAADVDHGSSPRWIGTLRVGAGWDDRELDGEDPVLVAGGWRRRSRRRRRARRRAGTARARSRAAGRRAPRRAAGARWPESTSSRPRIFSSISSGRCRRGRRAPPRAAGRRRSRRRPRARSRRGAAARAPVEQLVHLAPHALEVGEEVAL